MAEHKDRFPIVKMARLFGVSRSGYYRWLGIPPSARTIESRRLKIRIHRLWEDSEKTYGAPRIHRQLLAEGERISRPRVARLMKQLGIQSQIRRRWTATTDSSHKLPTAPNLLGRCFTGWGLGRAWVSDITYLPSRQGWLYLTIVMDLADRQILGWNLSSSLKAEQTSTAAFRQALGRRRPGPELLFHSDRGVQYACSEFTDLLDRHQVRQSMSRRGNCWDNAPAESFFKTLKAELQGDTSRCSYSQIRAAVFHFIEVWYNRRRLHSALDYRSPIQMEILLTEQHAAA